MLGSCRLDQQNLCPQSANSKSDPEEDAVRFLESRGKRAIINSLEMAEDGLAGRAGMTVVS